MNTIETERLIIRNFSRSDTKGMMDYLSNPRVNYFLEEKLSTIEEAISEA